jgi:hypothetical protein
MHHTHRGTHNTAKSTLLCAAEHPRAQATTTTMTNTIVCMCTCTFDDMICAHIYMMKEYVHHHHHYSHTTHGVCCCVLFVGMLWPREHNALHSLENLGKKTRTQTALHFSQSSERSYYLLPLPLGYSSSGSSSSRATTTKMNWGVAVSEIHVSTPRFQRVCTY